MFDTVGRYRDPEGPLRRIAAGCLLFLALSGTLFTMLAVWLAVWIWPWIKALLLFVLHALFGKVPAFLLDPIVVPEMAIAEVDVALSEPYIAGDPELVLPPLPGEEPPVPDDMALQYAMRMAMDDGPAIAHLRGWNDDDDYAVREAVMMDEMVASAGLIGLLGASSDSGAFENVLSSGLSADLTGGMYGDEIGDAFGSGGLGLSGIGSGGGGLGGGGTAEGLGGLGTIGTIGHGGGGGSGSGYGTGSGRMARDVPPPPRSKKEDRRAEELVQELGYLSGGVEGGEITGLLGHRGDDGGAFGEVEGGALGGVLGGVEGGVVGGVVGGSWSGHEDAQLVDRKDPEYPEEARAAGLGGTCVARVEVDTSGRGTLTSLTGCDPLFRSAVVKAVEKSRWTPAIHDGELVASTVTIRYGFSAE